MGMFGKKNKGSNVNEDKQKKDKSKKSKSSSKQVQEEQQIINSQVEEQNDASGNSNTSNKQDSLKSTRKVTFGQTIDTIPDNQSEQSSKEKEQKIDSIIRNVSSESLTTKPSIEQQQMNKSNEQQQNQLNNALSDIEFRDSKANTKKQEQVFGAQVQSQSYTDLSTQIDTQDRQSELQKQIQIQKSEEQVEGGVKINNNKRNKNKFEQEGIRELAVEDGSQSSFDKGDVNSFNTQNRQAGRVTTDTLNQNPNKLNTYNNNIHSQQTQEMGLAVSYQIPRYQQSEELYNKHQQSENENLEEAEKHSESYYVQTQNAQKKMNAAVYQRYQTHNVKYFAAKQKFKADKNLGMWGFPWLKEQLQTKPIDCVKYNYTLEAQAMNHFNLNAQISLSEDGKHIIIKNYTPNSNPEYQYDEMPDEIIAETKRMNEANRRGEKYIQKDQYEDQFTWNQSNASTSIDDIEGIVMGGTTSRFWIYRKHMCSMDVVQLRMDSQEKDKRTNFPFFAWQCISLVTSTRTIDLVIKNDREMDVFIRFLIVALNTIDGNKNTAQFLIEATTLSDIQKAEKRNNRKRMKVRSTITLADDEEWDEDLQWKYLTEEQKQRVKLKNTNELYRQAGFKFTLKRIRSKISYYAFKNRMVVSEYMMHTILKSYNELVRSDAVTPISIYSDALLMDFDRMLDDYQTNAIKDLKVLAQYPELMEKKSKIRMKKELQNRNVLTLEELPEDEQEKLYNVCHRNPAYESEEEEEEEEIVEIEDQPQSKPKKTGEIAGPNLNLFDYTKCQDIYYQIKVDKQNIYDQRSKFVMLKYKFDTKMINSKLLKVKFMLAIGELQDVFYLKAMLKKKSLVKKQFVLHVEHNIEVYIPSELSCDSLPISFRYYDPLILIINQLFSPKTKQFHSLRTEFYMKKNQGRDQKLKLFEQIGIIRPEKNKPLIQQHKMIQDKHAFDLRHTQSKHAIALQKSRYIMVESTEQGLMKLSQHQTYNLEKPLQKKWKKKEVIEDAQLELRYCQDAEVSQKKQKFLKFKQTQFMKHDNLKSQGQKLYTMRMCQIYVDENLEDLYAGRPRDLNYNPQQARADRDLDLKEEGTLTGRQVNVLEADKLVYAEYLLKISEEKVTARRLHYRMKLLEEVYRRCTDRFPFQEREYFVESRLEQRIKYFKNLDDINNEGSEIDDIMKLLQKSAK